MSRIAVLRVSSKDQAFSMVEKSDADILRISSMSEIERKFEGNSPDSKIPKSRLRKLKTLDVEIALDEGWISKEAFSKSAWREIKPKIGEW